jgi:hypothetical protein
MKPAAAQIDSGCVQRLAPGFEAHEIVMIRGLRAAHTAQSSHPLVDLPRKSWSASADCERAILLFA